MWRWISHSATRPTGTLTKKMARQDVQCTMRPPIVGPSSGPISAGTMTKFIAARSSLRGKVRMIASRPTGIIIAAPTPCRMRAATSIGGLVARPHNIDDSTNSATALENTRRVPKRSAIQPLTGMHSARLRMYAVTADFRLSGVTFRLAAIDGMAVLTMVESSCSMNSALATTQGR